jgi:hypothetical protein
VTQSVVIRYIAQILVLPRHEDGGVKVVGKVKDIIKKLHGGANGYPTLNSSIRVISKMDKDTYIC